MTSSRRNKLAAFFMFLLLAVVVVAGMAWATSSSFRLARKNVAEEHENKVTQAVSEISNYMAGIINSEAARDWRDYLAIQHRDALAVYTDDGRELDAQKAVIPSPLATGKPLHVWIDLYFQQGPTGELTSPQVSNDLAMWGGERHLANGAVDFQRRRMLAWLGRILPSINLHEQLASACSTGAGEGEVPVSAAGDPEFQRVSEAAGGSEDRWSAGSRALEFTRRSKTLRDSQKKYVPPADCVDADLAGRHVRGTAVVDNSGSSPTLDPRDEIQITYDPMTPFWLGEFDDDRKLAFVREVHADASVLYQGFVGDWESLKPRLIAQIRDEFPDAELIPILDDAEFSHTRMYNLPVRLAVAGVPGGAQAAAWREIRGTLLISWVAAAAVLVVAGWGLRNLVALTERRMQFAYAVTHELRTPLTTFRLYSDMLAAGLVPEPSKQEYLETLDRESLRLSSLVEEVLEYARLENHKVSLNPVKTDAPALLAKIAENLDKRCHDNGIIPRTESGITNGASLCTDVDLVNRIAAVLVNNACRHARGHEDATVVVRLDAEDAVVHLDVIDSGPGVDRADLRTIFKPFRRGRGADAAAHGGIGLGLALARSWAGLLGGRLDLAARHDPTYGGAHFRLTIPAQIES